jgi:hypothetical protein
MCAIPIDAVDFAATTSVGHKGQPHTIGGPAWFCVKLAWRGEPSDVSSVGFHHKDSSITGQVGRVAVGCEGNILSELDV